MPTPNKVLTELRHLADYTAWEVRGSRSVLLDSCLRQAMHAGDKGDKISWMAQLRRYEELEYDIMLEIGVENEPEE